MKASCQRAGRNFTCKEWELYFLSGEYRKTCPEFTLEPEQQQRGYHNRRALTDELSWQSICG